MKHLYKSIFLLLAIFLPATAGAYDFEVDGICYNINGNEATVTYKKYPEVTTTNYTGDVIIPYTVSYGGITYPVTAIGYQAFMFSNLTSVAIPNSVTSIAGYAFYDCISLHNIDIPNSVISIGNYAFSSCIGLTSITIPNSVTSIGCCAFEYCNRLSSITIPNSVSYIGVEAFNHTQWYDNQPDGLVYAGLIAYKYKGTIPNGTHITINDGSLGISPEAFSGCRGLTGITIPCSLTSIGDNAFSGCDAISNLTWNAKNCAEMGEMNKTNIEYVYIGQDVETLPSGFVEESKITEINIPNSVISIGSYAFSDCCRLTSIIIPNSVTSIGVAAFSGCNGLASVSIPNSVISIGYKAFYNCSSLTSVDIPNSVTSIGEGAFSGCNSLTSISIPNSVISIGKNAFSDCSGLTSITIPNSVTTIDDYAFSGCSGLTGILTIPNSVTFIGKQAFYNNPLIEAVTCVAETPPSWNDLAIFTTNVYNHSPLYVPLGAERAYMADQCWGQFSTIIGVQQDILATDITLNQSQISLQIGGTSQLIATVLPDETTNKAVNWTSSAPNVISVNQNGLVTALATGTATITATTTDGTNLSASCEVTVAQDISNYDNYLSISDAEAFHGDTIVIPVTMTNAQSILSFQTDIYLPEGLEVVQEDGEYVIDPSERMTRTHSIMSNTISNGAIRVLCYSSNYKPFTGNSGDDLFYITVKVADDAEGDYTIWLKNTLLTNSDFEELIAPNVASNIHVNAYLLGDANGSGTVTVTDVVVTSQYVLELNPQPFIFEAADVNADNNITVTDVTRIAWMVLNPTLNIPMRAPSINYNSDHMSGNDITMMPGETRAVSILLDNVMDYSAFQFDLNLPTGLTATNFQLTDRTGNHAFDVNALNNGKMRVLCYSPALEVINDHNGVLLTFDVTANSAIEDAIDVDGIELVTSACQTVKLNGFAIGVNTVSSINELGNGKTIARVDYFNMAGQQIDHPDSGVTLVVTTYTDGTRTTNKIIR